MAGTWYKVGQGMHEERMLAKLSFKGLRAKPAGGTMAVHFPDHSSRDASYKKEELPEV